MNTQFVEFKSKLCKEDRHWMCSRQWEGLVLLHYAIVLVMKKRKTLAPMSAGIPASSINLVTIMKELYYDQ